MDLKLILKSFMVGIGKIIPGVSGSLIAITLGIYESLIYAVTNFFANVKNNIKLLCNFGIGLILALILGSKFIIFCLNNYYQETMFLFLGLIIGTSITFAKKVKINFKVIFLIILFLCLILLTSNKEIFSKFMFTGSFLNYFYTMFLGIIDAVTSIIPGLSGTVIFMMLGVYEFVLDILSNPFSLVFIIYGIGLIIGIIFTCYLMNYLFKKHKDFTYQFIFILMFCSIISLLLSLELTNIYLLFIFVIGIIFGYLIDK